MGLTTAARPARPGGFKPRLIALLSRGLQLKPTQLRLVLERACVCARVRRGGWVVGGSRDNVTRLEMKHPHLQTSPSFAKSINGTDVCLFMNNNAVIDLTKTTARWRGSSWKVTRPKSPINERIN